MSNETRWIALLAVLGFITAYVLWGKSPPTETHLTQGATTPDVPTVSPQTTTQPGQQSLANFHGVTRLKFTPDSIEFGTVPVGDERDADIRVENPTDKPITIRDVRGSCGCLNVTAEKNDIAPHATINIHVHFKSISGRKVDHVEGLFNTDEANNSSASFTVRGIVKENFIGEGIPVKFDTMPKNLSKTKDLTIRSADGKPFAIQSIVGENPDFSYKWEPVADKGGMEYTIHVTQLGTRGGMNFDTATVQTDRTERSTYTFQSTGIIEQDLVCNPAILTADMDAESIVGTFTTVMKRTTPGRLEITSIKQAAKHPIPFEHVIDRLDDASCRISIRFTKAYPNQFAPYGHFDIQTNVEEKEYPLNFRISNKAGRPLPTPPTK